MTMPSLSRQATIGLVVSLCVVGALGATWWTATKRAPDSLAAHLPMESVWAYAEFGAGEQPDADLFARVAPVVPPIPTDLDESVIALAAVQLPNGTTGWMTMSYDEHGKPHIEGTDPALAALLTDARPSLATDRSFKNMRFNEGSWLYVASLGDDSVLAGPLDSSLPAAVRRDEDSAIVRLPLSPTPSLTTWTGRPLASLPDAIHTVLLPPFKTMSRIGTLLSPDTRLVIETAAGTFVDSIARGLSLRYDLPALLDGPSLLSAAINGSGVSTFSLEGRGRSAAETDRVLRLMHESFASSHGGSRAKTVSAEGFSLVTLTPDAGIDTVETRDGTWTILRTDASDLSLVSAHDGTRFAVTTDPRALAVQSGEGEPQRFDASSLSWTEGLAAGLQPLWPTLAPDGERLQVRLSHGPGYVEWAVGPLERL